MISSAPQLRRSDTTSTSAQFQIRTDRSAFLNRASRISQYQAPKRQRLCSESDISPCKEINQSPFFTSNHQLDEPSPLARKKVNKKNPRKSGFEVFSDSSIPDEDFLALADVQEFASPEVAVQYPKLDALEDSTERGSPQKGDSPQVILQSSPIRPNNDKSPTPDPTRSFDTVITNLAEGRVSQDTNPAAVDEDDVKPFEDIHKFYVREHNSMGKAFVRQSLERRETALASVASPHLPQSPRTVRKDLATFAAQSPEKQAAALQSMSPQPPSVQTSSWAEPVLPSQPRTDMLQAFAYGALAQHTTVSKSVGRRQSQDDKVEIAKAAMVSTTTVLPAARAATSLQRLGISALARKAPLAPAAPLQPHDEDHAEFGNIITADDNYSHVQGFGATKGSEDQMRAVPDSDEEGEYVDAPEEMERSRKLNLAAFAFTG